MHGVVSYLAVLIVGAIVPPKRRKDGYLYTLHLGAADSFRVILRNSSQRSKFTWGELYLLSEVRTHHSIARDLLILRLLRPRDGCKL